MYALNPSSGDAMKVSVHGSGQIHIRPQGRDLLHLAPPLPLGNGSWQHAFELRFLLDPDVYWPPNEEFKRDPACLIDVPADALLLLNLLVSTEQLVGDIQLPHELMPHAHIVWHSRLRDGRRAVLVARMRPIDEVNRKEMDYVRRDLNPKLNFEQVPKEPYVEHRSINSGAQGNVILVMPLGKEAVRVDGERRDKDSIAVVDSRTINLCSPSAVIPIPAPNGDIVATMSFVGRSSKEQIVKGKKAILSLGTIELKIDPSKLIEGSTFERPSIRCQVVPTIDGAQPRNWAYHIVPRFDGSIFTATLSWNSTSFRNANLAAPMNCLSGAEELVFRAPLDELTLTATSAAPTCTCSLDASALLRDI